MAMAKARRRVVNKELSGITATVVIIHQDLQPPTVITRPVGQRNSLGSPIKFEQNLLGIGHLIMFVSGKGLWKLTALS